MSRRGAERILAYTPTHGTRRAPDPRPARTPAVTPPPALKGAWDLMRSLPVLAPPRRFGQTARPDAWWVQPAVTFTILASFVLYATWAAFQNAHYTFGPYLSPFYSPEIFGDSHHAWFGPQPRWWPRA